MSKGGLNATMSDPLVHVLRKYRPLLHNSSKDKQQWNHNNKRQNNTRKLNNKSKIKSTRKNNSKYSEGFIRRMSEPVRLVPIKLSNEELARINKKMPPTL